MRLLKINLLAALAGLTLFATSASAIRVDFASPDFGSSIAVGDLVSVDVLLDTEAVVGELTLLGFGVLFDEGVFSYRQDLSSSRTYLLYTTAKNPYLTPASTCGGSTGTGCQIFATRSNQVQIDFLSSSLPNGVPGQTVGSEFLVNLVFEAVAPGQGDFSFDFDPFFGSLVQTEILTNPPLTLGASGSVTVVPEPTTAVLIGLGLAGLGIAGRRSRN